MTTSTENFHHSKVFKDPNLSNFLMSKNSSHLSHKSTSSADFRIKNTLINTTNSDKVAHNNLLNKLRAANRQKITLSMEVRKNAISDLNKLKCQNNNYNNSKSYSSEHIKYELNKNDKSKENIKSLTNIQYPNLTLKAFRMPVGNIAGQDVEEYTREFRNTTKTLKKSKTSNEKIINKTCKLPGVTYICGIPQPIKNNSQKILSKNISPIQLGKMSNISKSSNISLRQKDNYISKENKSSIYKKNIKSSSNYIKKYVKNNSNSSNNQVLNLKSTKTTTDNLSEEISSEDLDFIDDRGVEQDDWKNELRMITKYNPINYQNEILDDKMEASFNEICYEEKRTKRIGRKEDKYQEMLEAEHKLRKSKHKLK